MVDVQDREYTGTPTMMRPGEKPTLHEILMAEKLDFEAKVERAARRKRWLKGINAKILNFFSLFLFSLSYFSYS